MRPGPDQGLFLLEGADDLFTLKLALDRSGHITVGRSTHRGKVLGVNPDFPIQLAGLADHVIVEADGAAGMSVKAPKDWEPVLPEDADLVIGLVGLDCIGRSITEENVFRLDRFMELTGLDRGSHIGLDAVRTLALAKDGLFKGVDHQMVCALFLNKSDTMDNKPNWAQFADSIFSRGPARVRRLVVGSAMLGRVAEFHVKNH
jgi:probable selenium-dependent hydroxylase accessory protein YqeC